MRKLIAVGVLVGGLLAGAGSAMAQQGGIGDPLTLAASGVLIPYITLGGSVALVEVASPVNDNLNLHMIFFNNTCTRTDSKPIHETVNEIAFQDVFTAGAPPTGALSVAANGLVAIASAPGGSDLIPLESPIHSRVYLFNAGDGRSRVLEPIILDTAEFPSTVNSLGTSDGPTTWSPLRTGATFYAPQESVSSANGTIHTVITLICPRTTIQDNTTANNTSVFPTGANPVYGRFPRILPPFNTATTTLHGLIYDTDENLITNFTVDCDCLTEKKVSELHASAYILPGSSSPFVAGAAFGTYTELQTQLDTSGSFTGYKASFTQGSPNNNFFSRLSNGNKNSLGNQINSVLGVVTNAR